MKTRLPMPVLLCSAFLALAAAGVFAELRKGEYQPAALGLLPQSRPSEILPDSQYAGGPYPLYPPELESGEGKTEVEGYCSTCHSTRYITMQPPLPAAAWETEVTKMKKSFGATIPDEAVSRIAGYLQAHYTPETRKQ
jgi:hypothetical protein